MSDLHDARVEEIAEVMADMNGIIYSEADARGGSVRIEIRGENV